MALTTNTVELILIINRAILRQCKMFYLIDLQSFTSKLLLVMVSSRINNM